MEILSKYALEIFFGLVSAGALAFCKYLWSQKKKLEEVVKAEQTRQHRQMILDEIEPLIEEIHRVQKSTEEKILDLKQHHNNDRDELAHQMDLIVKKNEKNLELIVASYKFRFIQLCKIHLREKTISQDEFEQITEMYKLYSGLGGNGQAQEYYERVLDLPIE